MPALTLVVPESPSELPEPVTQQSDQVCDASLSLGM